MELDYNLGDAELRRVFDAMDTNGDGRMSIDEFKTGRGEHPFTKTLVETLSGACRLYSADLFRNENFDHDKSTAEFYGVPLEQGFFGENVGIRKSLDYTYHNNYSEERQLFQDALIKSNLLVGSGSSDPWYVLTCGPMVSSGSCCKLFESYKCAPTAPYITFAILRVQERVGYLAGCQQQEYCS
jgi:hypothetical protein